MGILVGITSGKGGSGKTTITETVATFINRYYDIDIAVIDADAQMSIFEDRESEMQYLKDGNISLLKAYRELLDNDKDLYKIYKANPKDIEYIAEITNKHDLIFIDIPGSLEVKGVSELFFFINYAFVPFSGERKSFRSHLNTLNFIKKIHYHKNSLLRDYAVFINQYSESKNLQVQRNMKLYFKNINVKELAPYYYDIRLQREMCSTVKAMSYSGSPKSIKHFTEDLLNTINIKY